MNTKRPARKALAMRIAAKGQVTIPRDIRELMGFMPGTDVAFEVEAGVVRVVKTKRGGGRKTRGQKRVESLRGQGDFRMSADEIIALMRGPSADEGWAAVILVDSNVIIDVFSRIQYGGHGRKRV